MGIESLGQSRHDLTPINPSAIKGEPGTGFEKRSNKGPFECGNCEYFDSTAGACDQWDMKTKSKQPRLEDGRPSVSWDDCCEYVERLGKPHDQK
jgi:hypothetical protein